ncbi:MAG: PKD domain-containing protein [Chitinophagales bacterium]
MKKILTLVGIFAAAFTMAQCPKTLAFDTSVCAGINRSVDATILKSRLCGDSILIVFNATGTALAGDTNVYMHSGPEFRSFTGWQNAYTAGTWGTNNGVGRMTSLGTNLWGIRINPRTYYNFSADSCLEGLFMVFRNFDGTKVAKDGTNDIYLWINNNLANPSTTYAGVTAFKTRNNNITYAWSDGPTDSVRTFTTGGFYTVTLTGIGGCTATGTVRIRTPHSPVSIGNDLVRCSGAPATVFSASTGFVSYQWNDRPTASAVNTYTATNFGTYWVKAIDSAGCISRDTARILLTEVNALNLPDTVSSCTGNPVNVDAAVSIDAQGDSLVIVYDATQGQTGLINVTKVYFHSGPEFRPFQGWQTQYTAGNWGQDDGIGLMTSLGNNRWRIAIDPQAYYGYSPDSSLNGIFMVFRNATGTATGKDNSGNNIFVNAAGTTPFSAFAGVTASRKARGPLSYNWFNGPTTSAIAISASGVYRVTVTDGSCSKVDSVRAVFSSSLTLNLGPDTTVCTGQNVLLNAGSGYVRYQWSTSANDTLSTKTVNTPGTYTVTATLANGCQATGSRIVSNPTKKVNLGADITRCANAPSTSLNAGSGFLSYQWLNGTAGASSTYAAVKAGKYWVKATDSIGCASYDTILVTTSAVAGLNLPDTLSTCPGNTLTADANTSIQQNGDSLIIVYDATQGQTGLAGASKVYMHSGAELHPFGGYQYLVGNWGQDDGIGKMDSLGNNRWRIAIVPQSYYGYHPDSSLNGILMVFRNANGSATGKDGAGNDIFINMAGATPASSFAGVTVTRKASGGVTYNWSNGPTTSSSSFTTSGVYYVTATQGVCSRVDSVRALFLNGAAINLGADTTICAGTTARLRAPSGFVHYSWSTGDTTSSILVNTPGLYSVTASSAGGCNSIGSRRVSISSRTVSLGNDVHRCNSITTTLTATSGFASYVWNSNLPVASNTFAAVQEGQYRVKAIDSFGCAAYDTVLVDQTDVLNLAIQDSATVCPGTSFYVNASTRIEQYGDSVVVWYNAAAATGVSQLAGASKVYFHSGPEFRAFTGWQTAYTVGNWGQDDGIGKMDSLGNNIWRFAFVPQRYYNYSPDSSLNGIFFLFRNANGTSTGKDNGGADFCLNLSNGQCTPSNGLAVTAKRKSAGNITYLWSNGATHDTVYLNTPGTYRVTATDAFGCSKSDTIVLRNTSAGIINLGRDTTLCAGQSLVLNAGTGYNSYSWSSGDTTRTKTVTAAGTYTVTAFNGACSFTGSIIVTYSGRKVTLGGDVTRCDTLPVTINAPAGFVSYKWFNAGNSSASRAAVKPGNYWVKATDSIGCVSYDTVRVRESYLSRFNLPDSAKGCLGDSVLLNGSVQAYSKDDSIVIVYDATQGTSTLQTATKVYMHSGVQFQPFGGWNNVVGNWGLDDGVGQMRSLGQNRWTITIDPAAYYSVNPDSTVQGLWIVFRNEDGTKTGKNATNGDIFLNLQSATPVSTFGGITASYKPTGTLTFNWSNGSNTPVIRITQSGTYKLTATDGICTKSDSVVASVAASPTVNLGKDTCVKSGSPIVLNAGAGYASYTWNTGASTQTLNVSAAGTYSVRVTNSNGCAARDTVVVTSCTSGTCTNFNAQFMIMAVSPNNQITIRDQSTGQALSYKWYFGDNTTATDSGNVTHTYAQGGVYTVMLVLSSPGCGTDTFRVTRNVNGIEEIGFQSVSVYPVPTNGQFTLSLNSERALELTLCLRSITGNLVQTKLLTVPSGESEWIMDATGLPAGCYFLTADDKQTGAHFVKRIQIIK